MTSSRYQGQHVTGADSARMKPTTGHGGRQQHLPKLKLRQRTRTCSSDSGVEVIVHPFTFSSFSTSILAAVPTWLHFLFPIVLRLAANPHKTCWRTPSMHGLAGLKEWLARRWILISILCISVFGCQPKCATDHPPVCTVRIDSDKSDKLDFFLDYFNILMPTRWCNKPYPGSIFDYKFISCMYWSGCSCSGTDCLG